MRQIIVSVLVQDKQAGNFTGLFSAAACFMFADGWPLFQGPAVTGVRTL